MTNSLYITNSQYITLQYRLLDSTGDGFKGKQLKNSFSNYPGHNGNRQLN